MINDLLIYFMVMFCSYLIGSIPFGLLFSNLMGYGDIRKIGSGNIGATNVLRTGNKTLALLVLISDALKGFLTIKALLIFLPNDLLKLGLSIAIFCCVFGHCFPIWLKFNGGKGVATAIGVILALNLFISLLICMVWIIILLFFKRSSLSSIISLMCAPLPILILLGPYQASSFLLVFLIIIYRHQSNIIRLINNGEPKVFDK